jgi:hypothetical protein
MFMEGKNNIEIQKISKRHVERICACIKNGENAKTNNNGNIISEQCGIVHIADCQIQAKINNLRVTINVMCESSFDGSVQSAEDIIRSVLPAAYSNDPIDAFQFMVSDVFSQSTYLLDILEAPENISVNINNWNVVCKNKL